MTKKRILICGATGFIGRNLAEYFAEKEEFEVVGTYHRSPPLKHPKIGMVKADLTDKRDVERVVKGADVLIQAAATTSGANDIVNKPYYHVTDNAVMNSLIFRSAFENKIPHVVFFSCTVMYPPSAESLKEEDFDANAEIFKTYFGVGWTKVYIEKMCEFYSRISNTKYSVLRHSNIYGPYDKYDLEKSHVFGATVAKVFSAEGGKIVVWGEGRAARDLLHVSDLVNCVSLLIEKQKESFSLFNVGLGKAVSVKELVEQIINYSGRDLKIEYDRTKPNITTALSLDCSKILKAVGWQPKISLEEGIQRTLVWYKQNILRGKSL